jgi:hypothetical protein
VLRRNLLFTISPAASNMVDLFSYVYDMLATLLIIFCICYFDVDGPALIGSYFEVTDSKTDKNCVEAQFRGRHLVGQVCKMPENSTGVVFCKQKSTQGLSSPDKNAIASVLPAQEIRSTFKTMTVWEHDVLPASSSGNTSNVIMSEIEEIISMAHAIHDI